PIQEDTDRIVDAIRNLRRYQVGGIVDDDQFRPRNALGHGLDLGQRKCPVFSAGDNQSGAGDRCERGALIRPLDHHGPDGPDQGIRIVFLRCGQHPADDVRAGSLRCRSEKSPDDRPGQRWPDAAEHAHQEEQGPVFQPLTPRGRRCRAVHEDGRADSLRKSGTEYRADHRPPGISDEVSPRDFEMVEYVDYALSAFAECELPFERAGPAVARRIDPDNGMTSCEVVDLGVPEACVHEETGPQENRIALAGDDHVQLPQPGGDEYISGFHRLLILVTASAGVRPYSRKGQPETRMMVTVTACRAVTGPRQATGTHALVHTVRL